jgi:hypothetical protein
LIDPEEADRLWPPRVNGGTALGTGGQLAQERAAKTVIEAQRAKLELDRRRGELISRATAVNAAFSFARMLRDRWQAWPTRVGPLLAAQFELDAGAVTAVLEGYVREHLAELASERCEF